MSSAVDNAKTAADQDFQTAFLTRASLAFNKVFDAIDTLVGVDDADLKIRNDFLPEVDYSKSASLEVALAAYEQRRAMEEPVADVLIKEYMAGLNGTMLQAVEEISVLLSQLSEVEKNTRAYLKMRREAVVRAEREAIIKLFENEACSGFSCS